MTPSEILKRLSAGEFSFVDLRFTDTRGKEQHVTVTASSVDGDFFESGKPFDGSSISGWKQINESDMVLMPDAASAVTDPFTAAPTLILRCDVVEPATLAGYARDPRSIGRRAEAYLKASGIADAASFGPENEFFIFDDVRWGSSPAGAFYEVDSREANWNSGRVYA
ncbi:MAG: glutamine synthetase beta-grasp domain-containing protein, partial [Gammaproteobacteria bacterium]